MPLPEVARTFNERAAEYDSWHDTSPLFDIEVETIQACTVDFRRPGLEVGVGPGRFAQALDIEFGVDPALSPLQLANHRSIIVLNGTVEQLPVRTQSIGTVYLFFTLCFLSDPVAAVSEFFRTLKPDGYVVIGLIPAHSPWGRHLAQKGQDNNPYYRFAKFRTIADTEALLSGGGFHVCEAWSTLFQAPSKKLVHERPCAGARENAGFCVLIARKKGVQCENS